MLRSMYSAISGMQGFQTKLDVIGNNIANVNTPGFKAGRVDFADVLSQTMSGGSAPAAGNGGTNPAQVGLGVRVVGIDNLFTQGGNQSTGVATDLAINGDGFFTVTDATGQDYLTREGDFSVDSGQNLVLPDGKIAEGFGFIVDTTKNPNVPLTLDTSKREPVNLNQLLSQYVGALAGFTDSDGGTYSNPSNNSISYTLKGTTVTRTFSLSSAPDLQVGPDGSLSVILQYTDTDPVSGATVGSGTMRATIGKLAIATVDNPGGMEKVGDTLFVAGTNSGTPSFQVAGTNNTGTIASGFLEMSNVDLTREFTEMIVAQRGFDANSHVIGTANAILQDIVNLKNS
ncbi:MAG: flagellar hook-basal body complex protein [Alicyclobacillus macrosporangiidus]|uniref:flagellar hook-basal body complex protein n=1 Tax=Alicyclobacillus macrosporangiidus TaxID=392015 RepID=UPI0026F16C7B|nr:flagellar hook-basal body complex protein [Alicyclobacillus macrosporangiidus]MCL6597361.1 flagellar hook-basal body complex protein [Alicyclobacillus macrosporangiidus]